MVEYPTFASALVTQSPWKNSEKRARSKGCACFSIGNAATENVRVWASICVAPLVFGVILSLKLGTVFLLLCIYCICF